MTKADLDKRPGDVSAMFDQIAERYDLLNDVLSLGQDRLWRRFVAATVAARPGERVLDIAAGTGTSSRTFTTAGAYCVACDFSLGMLQVGARKAASRRRPDGATRGGKPPRNPPGADPGGRPPGTPRSARGLGRASRAPGAVPVPAPGPVRFAAGDALALPFREGAFDAVTISFGLRNVADPDAALAEMLRVTRPGGRLVICEFGHLPSPRLDAWYGRYLSAALPAVARRLSPSGDAYEYLAESIREWPRQAELARRIGTAGWTAIRWRNLTLGVVAVHAALRPE
jgi:demethylmenaquinone methyltransferase/2-methoxy-6-polyprenyl-1,4-benzoquinol methylase